MAITPNLDKILQLIYNDKDKIYRKQDILSILEEIKKDINNITSGGNLTKIGYITQSVDITSTSGSRYTFLFNNPPTNIPLGSNFIFEAEFEFISLHNGNLIGSIENEWLLDLFYLDVFIKKLDAIEKQVNSIFGKFVNGVSVIIPSIDGRANLKIKGIILNSSITDYNLSINTFNNTLRLMQALYKITFL